MESDLRSNDVAAVLEGTAGVRSALTAPDRVDTAGRRLYFVGVRGGAGLLPGAPFGHVCRNVLN
jgi:hypothetical protein